MLIIHFENIRLKNSTDITIFHNKCCIIISIPRYVFFPTLLIILEISMLYNAKLMKKIKIEFLVANLLLTLHKKFSNYSQQT